MIPPSMHIYVITLLLYVTTVHRDLSILIFCGLTEYNQDVFTFYECEWMLFGLVNALATFQRLMETCLAKLQLNWCLIYLDDIIVFSKHQKNI